MQVARVYTNETCTQNCAFCDTRRTSERRDHVAPAAVRRRIEDAAGSASVVVLTGGEPSMRRDLPELVRHARELGAEVHLETNGALVTNDLAATLSEAGLALARVHLPAWGSLANDITRDPDAFHAALAAMRALHGAGIPVQVSTPIVRANASVVEALPGELAALDVPVAALVLGVPVDAPDRGTLLPLREAAAVVEATEAAARKHDLALRVDDHTHLPPCLFENVPRIAHLFTLTPGGATRKGYSQLAGCAHCEVRDRCPGVPLSSAGSMADVIRPIREDRIRRRLSVITSVAAQIRRELHQDEIHRGRGIPAVASRTVRINFRCNQVCRFCFVSTHLDPAPHEDVERAIVEMARRGGMISISGGEPTLNPRVVEYVALAKREGAIRVELQTNATRLAENDLAERLAAAGVDDVFVSLHGSRAEISDAVTGAPGTFEKTVAGLDRAIQTSMRLRLNFVFCELNREDFPLYVQMVTERWPGTEVTMSFVAASTDVVPRTRDLMPRYSEVLPYLTAGLRIGRSNGLEMRGFDSMCGMPLCLVPDDVSEYFEYADVPEGFDRGEFIDTDACLECDLRGKCFGVRRGYAMLHGTSEFRPVRRQAPVPPISS